MTYEVIKRVIDSFPITTAEGRKQLNIEDDFTDDDAIIDRLITASAKYCGEIVGNNIFKTTVTHKISNFSGGTIRIKEVPFREFVSITYTDASGVSKVLVADTDYYFFEDEFYVDLVIDSAYGESKAKIVLVYLSGYADDAIPEDIYSAILIQMATLYDHERSGYSDYKSKANRAVLALLSPYIKLI